MAYKRVDTLFLLPILQPQEAGPANLSVALGGVQSGEHILA